MNYKPEISRVKYYVFGFVILAIAGIVFFGNSLQPPKTYTNSINMEFVLISAGEFDTDSPSNEAGHLDGEGTVHNVKISNAFYMGKYEVTQKQWSDVMGTSFTFWQGDNLPVVLVSWTGKNQGINGYSKVRL